MQFLYGKLEKEIPEHFAPPEQWPEYGSISDPVPIASREEVGENPRGKRWALWPLCFEEYFSDTEPDLQKSKEGRLAYNRLITWKRVRRAAGAPDAPKGWWKSSKKTWRVDGFFDLKKNPDYAAAWQKNARRDLRIWQECYRGRYPIEQISFAEYAAAYKKSTVARRVNMDRLEDLERKIALPLVQKNTALWGVRDRDTNKVLAGTAIIRSPASKSSTHFAPFILPEAARLHAGTALMNHWFAQARALGDAFAVTTNFWYRGQPKSWKGFSEFKSHFGWSYCAYPPMLFRLARGKLF